MHIVEHPGPVGAERILVRKAHGRKVSLTLSAGIPLEAAVAQALDQIDWPYSAYLEITDAAVSDLAYVMPDQSPDKDHVAWYSKTDRFDGPGVIQHLGMIVGYREQRCFIHGHGTWAASGQAPAMGHILGPMTVLDKPAVATGYALSGARFEGAFDPETNFTLFQPVTHGQAVGEDAEFALVRLLPNQDFDQALDEACAKLGWTAAQAWGVGSINTPNFTDGRVMRSLPTELLVLDAEARTLRRDDRGALIKIVGTKPVQIEQGHLKRGHNGVLITAELLLKRIGDWQGVPDGL